jgi:glutamate-1-semialdehyde aminotransferase
MIEPARGEEAPEDYLQTLREIASEIGAVLIYDEITSGYRMCAGGIHRRYKIYPDIAVFAKSMANGYAMSAILGKEEVMQAAQSTFISSTNWTDRVGPSAALATLKKYQETQTDKHIISIGNKTQQIWRDASLKAGLQIDVTGLPSLSAFGFKSKKSMELNTRFVTEMLQRGFLGFRQFKPSLAHSDVELEKYKNAVDDVFSLLSKLPNDEIISTSLAHTGFHRLTKE